MDADGRLDLPPLWDDARTVGAAVLPTGIPHRIQQYAKRGAALPGLRESAV